MTVDNIPVLLRKCQTTWNANMFSIYDYLWLTNHMYIFWKKYFFKLILFVCLYCAGDVYFAHQLNISRSRVESTRKPAQPVVFHFVGWIDISTWYEWLHHTLQRERYAVVQAVIKLSILT